MSAAEAPFIDRLTLDTMEQSHRPTPGKFLDPTQSNLPKEERRTIRYCDGCGMHWPCDAIRLVRHLTAGGRTAYDAELTAALEALEPFAMVYDRGQIARDYFVELTVTEFRMALLARDALRRAAGIRRAVAT